MRAILLIALAVLGGSDFLHAQPVNDHFSNRVVLAGSSLTFTADLAGASREPDESWGGCLGHLGSRSVWYELRTEEALPVFLQSIRGASNEVLTSLTIYADTNPPPSVLTGRPIFDCMLLKGAVDRPFLGFEAQPGFAYYFQVFGFVQGTFELQLDVTRSPIIIEHPRDITANPGAASVFKTAGISITPTRYQWMRSEVAMPGETSPMLMITNLTAGDAGGYSVVVSNDTGSATSRVAQLSVAAPVTGPVLRMAPGADNTSRLEFGGDVGRSYRVESSTDLFTWSAEQILNSLPLTSVVLQTNSQVSVSVSSAASRKFFRVGTYVPMNNVCDANLKRIRHAKELWGRDAHRTSPYDTPNLIQLIPYYKDGVEPRCPAGGYYVMNQLNLQPTCTIPTHRLEEPR